MDGGVEEAFATTLRHRAVARILCDVRDQAGIENALPIMRGINAPIEVEIRSAARSNPTSLATFFSAFRPSGNRTMSVSLTGATGTGAKT
jgi:hypothetical protein